MKKIDRQHDVITSRKWYQQYYRFVQLKGLGGRSIKSYLGWIHQLADHYPDQHLPTLKSGQVLDFLLHLQTGRDLKGSTVNQAVCTLRTFRDGRFLASPSAMTKTALQDSLLQSHQSNAVEVDRWFYTSAVPRVFGRVPDVNRFQLGPDLGKSDPIYFPANIRCLIVQFIVRLFYTWQPTLISHKNCWKKR